MGAAWCLKSRDISGRCNALPFSFVSFVSVLSSVPCFELPQLSLLFEGAILGVDNHLQWLLKQSLCVCMYLRNDSDGNSARAVCSAEEAVSHNFETATIR